MIWRFGKENNLGSSVLILYDLLADLAMKVEVLL